MKETLCFNVDFTNCPQIHDKDGWELAVAILNRLDQPPEGGRKILDLLDTLELHDEVRVDKVLGVCDAFELTEQRRSIAEVCSPFFLLAIC